MSAAVVSKEAIATLDLPALRGMTFKELHHLYQNLKAPANLSHLDGQATGAMLAWRIPAKGPLAWLLRKLGEAPTFPWEGQSFGSFGTAEGNGINRVNFFGRRRWFPFATRFGPSIIDGKQAFVLDYSARKNPPLIRAIVDEVREAAPGLYFGPAALKVGGRPRLILFFALSYPDRSRDGSRDNL